MIDWARVTELREEVGADDFGEIVDIFLEEVEGALGALGDGAAPLPEQLHFLKGSALNLGFHEFADLCHGAEHHALSDAASVDLDPVRQSFAQSRTAFLQGISARFAA